MYPVLSLWEKVKFFGLSFLARRTQSHEPRPNALCLTHALVISAGRARFPRSSSTSVEATASPLRRTPARQAAMGNRASRYNRPAAEQQPASPTPPKPQTQPPPQTHT